MMEVAHNFTHLNQIFNNSNYSVDTYLQDLEQMVALESNTDFNRRTNKFPDASNIEMLEYQLRQKDRLKNRDRLLGELTRLKDEELKKHKNFVKSDIRKNVLKNIKRLKGNKAVKFKVPSQPSFQKLPSIGDFIDNHGPPNLSLDSDNASNEGRFNPASMLRNMIRGIDFLGAFRQLYNAALPLLNIGARLGLGIGTDVFGKIDDSRASSQSLAIQNQALSRSDFVPELSHWFRRTIWFLGFSAVWTLSPSLGIITIILAVSYEAILFLVPSLQEGNYNQRIDEDYVFHGNDYRMKPITNFRLNHMFQLPRPPYKQIFRVPAPVIPSKNMVANFRVYPNKLIVPFNQRKIVSLRNRNSRFQFPFSKFKHIG